MRGTPMRRAPAGPLIAREQCAVMELPRVHWNGDES
jgi:hypothetical protein